MKLLSFLVALLTLSMSATPLLAQKPQMGCVDVNVSGRADAIKLGFTKKGLSLFQEATFTMASMEPVPVAVKLYQGVTYQLIFVGSEKSTKMIMELYDGRDKKIDEEVEHGSSNNIIYSFTPKKTDVYLVTLIQKRGIKEMCGYFAVMMNAKSMPVANQNAPQNNNRQQAPHAAPVKENTQTVPVAAPPVPQENANEINRLPPNQVPNRNRTRATNEALREQGR